jgi:hypothetical protein
MDNVTVVPTAPPMEPISSYREASPGVRRELRLFPDRVSISGRVLGGSEFETHVPLQQLSPTFGTMKFRSRRCVAGVALFCGLAVFVFLFVGPFQLPWASTRVIIATALAVASLGWAIAYFPRYTAYRFLNVLGQVTLDVVESGPDKASCRDFVQRIVEAIKATQAIQPA